MNYNYTSIKVIDGEIKAVVNKEAEPHSINFNAAMGYATQMSLWRQNHEVFEFANSIEWNKVTDNLNISSNPTWSKILKNNLEVTYIEIKDGFAWFKEEKEEKVEESQEGIAYDFIQEYQKSGFFGALNNFKITRK